MRSPLAMIRPLPIAVVPVELAGRQRDPGRGVGLDDGRRGAARVPHAGDDLRCGVRRNADLDGVAGRTLGEHGQEVLGEQLSSAGGARCERRLRPSPGQAGRRRTGTVATLVRRLAPTLTRMSLDAPSLERLSASAVQATVDDAQLAHRDPVPHARADARRRRADHGSPRTCRPERGDPRAAALGAAASRSGSRSSCSHRRRRSCSPCRTPDAVDSSVDWLPLIESAINDLVFAAIAVFFLHAFPNRLQRGQLLALLHRLRSLAHIVDMHQLTKDPERLRDDFVPTTASPAARPRPGRDGALPRLLLRAAQPGRQGRRPVRRGVARPAWCSTPSARSRR